MALRNPTRTEAEQIVFDAVGTVSSFSNEPGDPGFTNELISWVDILALPPVTKTWLYTQVLVAAFMLRAGGSRPSMSQEIFFEHVDSTAKETVARFRNFLMNELVIDL